MRMERLSTQDVLCLEVRLVVVKSIIKVAMQTIVRRIVIQFLKD